VVGASPSGRSGSAECVFQTRRSPPPAQEALAHGPRLTDDSLDACHQRRTGQPHPPIDCIAGRLRGGSTEAEQIFSRLLLCELRHGASGGVMADASRAAGVPSALVRRARCSRRPVPLAASALAAGPAGLPVGCRSSSRSKPIWLLAPTGAEALRRTRVALSSEAVRGPRARPTLAGASRSGCSPEPQCIGDRSRGAPTCAEPALPPTYTGRICCFVPR